MQHWSVGDRVTVTVPTDHPEDPVGEVVMLTTFGEVVVKFPKAGTEIHPPNHLTRAPRAPLHTD